MSLTQPGKQALLAIRIAVFLLALLPAVRLIWAACTADFGPNPVEFLQRFTGIWAFNLLLLSLCITPLRVISGWHWLLRLRRMLGLYAFFYASLHALSFFAFDHGFAVDEIIADIIKRPFISAGFVAFVLLIPLALSSNQFSIRHLGGKRWQALHRSVYAIAIIAAVHYLWLVKITAIVTPLLYCTLVILLLAWRALDRWRRIQATTLKAAQKLR